MSRFKMTRDYELLHKLHKKAFPGEEVREFESGDICWLMLDYDGAVLGFCSLKPIEKDTVFLSRAGVFKPKTGLHRRSIKYRAKWAKRNGYKWAVTYASTENHKSVANLIKCGLELYEPSWQYAGKGFLYFRLYLG